MREGRSRERLLSPPSSTPRRPWSVREVYHPAVQDLSEQAARNGSVYQEESILSVISSCTPRHAKTSSDNYSDKFNTATPLVSQISAEEIIKLPPTAQLCFNQHNNEFHEDLHRQRVLVSAHQRFKLSNRIRRAKSTPPSSNDSLKEHRNSVPSSDVEEEKFNFLVTNGFKGEEKDNKERIHYKLTSRTKPKTAQGGLMANGSPLPTVNGYTQTLIQSFPTYTQTYCDWLTNGLKVQSFRVNNHHLREYNHSRPPPPLLQYINRPKTIGVSHASKRSKKSVAFNIVGVHKETNEQKRNHANQLIQNDTNSTKLDVHEI